MSVSTPPQISTPRCDLPTFSNVMKIIYMGLFHPTIIRVIDMMAPHLLELEIRIPLARSHMCRHSLDPRGDCGFYHLKSTAGIQ
jgi:hypothetical protein